MPPNWIERDGGANITFGSVSARVAAGIEARLARRPSDEEGKGREGAGWLRWRITTTPTMMLVRRRAAEAAEAADREHADPPKKSRLKIRGIQICGVVGVGVGGGLAATAAAAAAHLRIDRQLSVGLRCGRRCRTRSTMVMASSLRGACACVRVRVRSSWSHTPCALPVGQSPPPRSFPPSASVVRVRPPMPHAAPWLMMAIVEAAGRGRGHTTAPGRRSSPRWAG